MLSLFNRADQQGQLLQEKEFSELLSEGETIIILTNDYEAQI